MSTTAWIILGIVVLVIVAVVVFFGMNQRAGARRARAEKIRIEAAERAAEIERKEAEANAMAAQAQDARAEADRLESVSAEQREETGADSPMSRNHSARRTASPDVRPVPRTRRRARRATAEDTSPRRATDEVSDDADVRDRRTR